MDLKFSYHFTFFMTVLVKFQIEIRFFIELRGNSNLSVTSCPPRVHHHLKTGYYKTKHRHVVMHLLYLRNIICRWITCLYFTYGFFFFLLLLLYINMESCDAFKHLRINSMTSMKARLRGEIKDHHTCKDFVGSWLFICYIFNVNNYKQEHNQSWTGKKKSHVF